MLLRQTIITLMLLLSSNFALAGGSYFEVQITSIISSESSFQLVADVLNKFNYDSSGCKTIHVKGYFDQTKWKGFENFINLESHLQSIKLLQDSEENKQAIRFGYIGAGLKRNGSCSYSSKGLFYEDKVVVSVYTPI